MTKSAGALSKPIDWDLDDNVDRKETLSRLAKRYCFPAEPDRMKVGGVLHLLRGVLLLCERYGIALTARGDINWMQLVFELVIEHQPDFFRLEQRRGKGRPRNLLRDIMLVLDIEKVRSERGCSASEAVHILVTSPRFAKRWHGEKKKTLENSLKRLREDEKLTRLIRDMRDRERGFDLWEALDKRYTFAGHPEK